jgi:phosphate system cyclin PHO80
MSDQSFSSGKFSDWEEEEDEDTRNQSEKDKNQSQKEDEHEIKNINLIQAISEILTKLIEQNKKQENYKEIILKQKNMIFSANPIPKISIYDYLIRINKYSEIETSTLICSLILIDHISQSSDIILTYYNIHRIIFAAILASIKYNEDSFYGNKFYAEIAGVKLKELNMIEYTFLELTDFNVFIKTEEYKEYTIYLKKFYEISLLEN